MNRQRHGSLGQRPRRSPLPAGMPHRPTEAETRIRIREILQEQLDRPSLLVKDLNEVRDAAAASLRANS